MTVHATAVALRRTSGWRAVLLQGRPGSGKSDLALRLLARGGWRLVGDDQVHVWACEDALYTAPAERLAGILEVRAVGLMSVPCLPQAQVALVVQLDGAPERLPEARLVEMLGIRVPTLVLDASSQSAADKLHQALAGRDALSRLEP